MRERLPRIPPPSCARPRVDLAKLPYPVEVERRRGRVITCVVLVLEDSAHEREPVRVDARRRKPDDGVTDFDPRSVDHPVPFDDPDAGAGEVEFVLLVDAR
jgi:hypothetical protein